MIPKWEFENSGTYLGIAALLNDQEVFIAGEALPAPLFVQDDQLILATLTERKDGTWRLMK